MKKEDKIVNQAYNDTKQFLINDTKKWTSKKGSFISYGLLNAVFEMLFSMTNKYNVMEVIIMSLSNFLNEEEIKFFFKSEGSK